MVTLSARTQPIPKYMKIFLIRMIASEFFSSVFGVFFEVIYITSSIFRRLKEIDPTLANDFYKYEDEG